MLRFYLASAWENKKQVREVAAKLEAAGWKWVYDWTQHREGEERLAAIKEIEAVKRADIVIVLLPGGLAAACHAAGLSKEAEGLWRLANAERKGSVKDERDDWHHPGA